MMEEIFKEIAGYIALALEVVSAIVITYGAVKAILRLLMPRHYKLETAVWKKTTFLHLGTWLILGLEFELAADIIRSAIAPSWESIGKLAAIAAIRTFLNYFLERDVEKLIEKESIEKGEVKTEHTQEAFYETSSN
jgi:uncharacterized membrane protein